MGKCKILLFFLILAGCSKTSNENKIGGLDVTKNKLDNSGTETAFYAKELFKIKITSFFETDKVFDFIKATDNYSMGLYVPLSFSVDSENLYLPNREKNMVYNYNIKNGSLKRRIDFDTLRLDYINLLSDKSWLVSSWGGKLWGVSDKGIVLYSSVNQDLYAVSSSLDNILYRTKNGFNDKKGYFKDASTIDLFDVVFDYHFINDSLMLLSYVNKDEQSLVISFIPDDRKSFEIQSSEDLKFNDYFGLRILEIYQDRLKCVVTNDNQNDPIIFFEVDLKKKKIIKKHQIYLGENETKFIGEGALIWPNGWVLKYYNSNLYIVYTTKDYISFNVVSGI